MHLDDIRNGSSRWLSGAERGLTQLVQMATILAGSAMAVSTLTGIFFRYVMQDSLSWTSEVALLCFSWTVFLAAALVVRDNGHVRVEVIESMLPKSLYGVLQRIIWLGIVLIGGFMVWAGWEFISLTVGQTSAALRYPLWLRELSLPVSGFLIMLYAVGHLFAPTANEASMGPMA